MTLDRQPHEYARRILLAVTGLSPQVVTESVYYLAVKAAPPFVPTEIHLITTRRGAEHARLTLLSEDPGWFARLRREHGLPSIEFGEAQIRMLVDNNERILEDIRSPEDNECTADVMTEYVRELTADPEVALHVSIAGGRKTMGFYAGYALSLYGRPQDRLSHVLVSPPFEGHPDFFYPTRTARVLYSLDASKTPMDTRTAQVMLAEIPFVRLRCGLDERLLEGRAYYSQVVRSAQRALRPAELVIDLERRRVSCGGVEVALASVDVAFLAWFARRAQQGQAGVCRTAVTHAECQEFIELYRGMHDALSGEAERLAHALRHGMDQGYFDQRRSRLHKQLIRHLGPEGARPYQIRSDRRRPKSRYRLDLSPERVHFSSLGVGAASLPDTASASRCR